MAKVKQKKTVQESLQEAIISNKQAPFSIPDNWCWVQLGELSSIKTGKHDANHAKENGHYRFYTCSANYTYCDTYMFEGEAVIVPGNGDIGLVFYYDGKFDAYQRTYVISKFNGSTKYLYYYFYYMWREKNEDKLFGTAIPYVRLANLTDFEIPIAPSEEQQRIVDKIESLFSKLDEAKELIQKTLDEFEDRKAAILHKAFNGKLVLFRKPESVTISEVARINPKTKKIVCDDSEMVSFVPMRVVSETSGKVKEVLFEKYEKVKKGFTYFEQGDVLFAKITPCMENGKCFIADDLKGGFGFASTEFYVFKIGPKILNKYLWYILRHKTFRDKAAHVMTGAVGQQRVPKQYLENYIITLPSLEEQQEIVRILDSFFEKEDKSKELLDMIDQIEEMKKSILSRAFRGELGTHSDTDEPAIELVKRILSDKNI